MANSKMVLRHEARKLALQGLYAWQLSGDNMQKVKDNLLSDSPVLFEPPKEYDESYFNELTYEISVQHQKLDEILMNYLDRNLSQINPVEHGILWIASFELDSRHDIPVKVVINEAIELAKKFGAVESHKYINGVLDKLAKTIRPKGLKKSKVAAN